MKNVVFVSASPKINEKSVSTHFLQMAGSELDETEFNKTFVDVRKSISSHSVSEAFETLAKADAIIISFPLYVFCLPGILTRFLQDYYNYHTKSGIATNHLKVYAIVNCGFPEPEINLEAVRVIKSFSQHINATFQFGILIGGGPMMFAAKDAPFMKKAVQKLKGAFSSLATDLKDNNVAELDSIKIGFDFPFARRLYFFMGNRGWISMARKNGLQKKDLYKQPYRLKE
ncbi:MAG: NAD(P)H-dependent oxidoreductase [Clostridiales bacterium]|jgi:putative NADPH-quinone reductase|nr:NAD(P)H-dependent oxidoreductase [Clostridiales bacterium]